MSTAVAPSTAAPLPVAPLDRDVSPKSYPSIRPPSSGPAANGNGTGHGPGHGTANGSPATTPNARASGPADATADGISPRSGSDGKLSPRTARNGPPPKIIVKKEPPTSPDLQTSRHRPRKLDLSKGSPAGPPLTSRQSGGPLTSRDGSGIVMHDVGLACLSPGFSTQDPTMREQLQRSISVRDQQRHIIESRLQKTAKPGEGETAAKQGELPPHGGAKTPSTSRRRAPPGLSIVAPSHEQFANERVIQSAPLHRSFPSRHQPEPMTRHVANQPSNLSSTSHIHHVPATQTNNRLPPITDVFASEGLGVHREGQAKSATGMYQPHSNSNSSHSNTRPPFPSPGQQAAQPPTSASGRPREYRSAEEHLASMSGGRDELLPKIIHYGGHQPPTPPSPLTANGATPQKPHHPSSAADVRSGGGRRRARAEYERDMGTPPLGSGREPRRAPFGEDRDSPESNRRKKEEFLSLCSRAWELFHS
ncbi:MAG: hypothetical protein M1832_005829 [Thelocarpon impressellum]|nr:MAG: hypothetical protein M1832_005829 [Thelocarpon impressellum]